MTPRTRPATTPSTRPPTRPTDDAEDADDEADVATARTRRTGTAKVERLENEGDIAADYLEELLDIADLDGDLDMDVEGDRASVSIVGADLHQLVGVAARSSTRSRS